MRQSDFHYRPLHPITVEENIKYQSIGGVRVGFYAVVLGNLICFAESKADSVIFARSAESIRSTFNLVSTRGPRHEGTARRTIRIQNIHLSVINFLRRNLGD